jgi:hypothetical protein
MLRKRNYNGNGLIRHVRNNEQNVERDYDVLKINDFYVNIPVMSNNVY